MPFILSLNCGSSSLKSKLFSYEADSPSSPLNLVASASASNVGAKDKKIGLKVAFMEGETKEEERDQKELHYTDLPGVVLELLTKGEAAEKRGITKDEIKIVTHRVVHGAEHTEGIIVTKDQQEGLKNMDSISSFAPLHNHNAVLAVRSVLEALPNHTSVLLFDTLFHQTLSEEIYTYAIPETEEKTPVPLRKYGFHGLSYASVLRSLSEHLGQEEEKIDAVVCHLGSGGSLCMIEGGKSKDTSMGLTPLEGIIGGTRSGSIDPTLIFHHTPDCSDDKGSDGMKITKAELVLNKSSGLVALAGTSDFGTICSRMEDPKSCSPEEHKSATLAYQVYLDRLLHYLSFYIFKLKSSSSRPLNLCFSGGIGERAVRLRKDVAARLAWLGFELDESANLEAGKKKENVVDEITTKQAKGGGAAAGTIRAFVVQTDEEVQCARMARAQLKC